MQLARSLDPRQIAPLRRGPLCLRVKEPRTSWRDYTGLVLRVVICLLVVAGIVWIGL
jgi:hypothetical protein